MSKNDESDLGAEPSWRGMNDASCARYVVITPARDEAEYIEKTIRSMIEQSHRPSEWVIVDDGSSDETAAIAERYASEHDWIRVVRRVDRGFRAAGSGVMEAFFAGHAVLDVKEWDYIVKLDGDLSFAPDYFQRCLAQFDQDSTLGIGGGVIYNQIGDVLERENKPKFHVRGATKIYRRACWDAIGGLLPVPGWDTLDELKANLKGWKTRSFDDTAIVQHRVTGEAAGQWKNWVKNGKANYISGYHPLYVAAKAARNVITRPYVKASVGLTWGFLAAWFGNVPRVDDPDLIKYVQQQQLRRLFGLKSVWN